MWQTNERAQDQPEMPGEEAGHPFFLGSVFIHDFYFFFFLVKDAQIPTLCIACNTFAIVEETKAPKYMT